MASRKKTKPTDCPEGHRLPTPGCSPLFCKDATALAKAPKKEAPKVDDEELREKLSYAVSRQRVRSELVPVPDLAGAEAEEFVEDKKVRLLPVAVAELEFQLKYGDNKERIDAARDVLRMNGMLNRDAPTGVAPTIVINMGGKKLPWQKKEEVIDAEVTSAKAR